MARCINTEENDAYSWDAKEKFYHAQLGNAEAQNDLGVFYQSGRGVPLNLQKAFYWISKAADQGVAVAMYNLGQMYYEGIGCPKDDCKAFYWWNKSAIAGHKNGIQNTAVAYYTGVGTPINIKQAEYFFLKAADNHSRDAMYYLGLIYSSNMEFYDKNKALKWLQRAADLGDREAYKLLFQI